MEDQKQIANIIVVQKNVEDFKKICKKSIEHLKCCLYYSCYTEDPNFFYYAYNLMKKHNIPIDINFALVCSGKHSNNVFKLIQKLEKKQIDTKCQICEKETTTLNRNIFYCLHCFHKNCIHTNCPTCGQTKEAAFVEI